MSDIPASDRLILALDVHEHEYALEIIDKCSGYIAIFKVGLELFTSCGPSIVEDLHRRGKKVFLDLKFHDIPNTVTKASLAAMRMGVHMLTIHASGGLEMMKRCMNALVEACLRENRNRPKILAVTVLTSLSREILRDELGIQYGLKNHVRHLAALALKAGLDGVVSSPRECESIRNHCGRNFLIVTPGIRPSWTLPDDQRRTMTPKEALRGGADYLVIGRAILEHPDPVKALESVTLEILSA